MDKRYSGGIDFGVGAGPRGRIATSERRNAETGQTGRFGCWGLQEVPHADAKPLANQNSGTSCRSQLTVAIDRSCDIIGYASHQTDFGKASCAGVR